MRVAYTPHGPAGTKLNVSITIHKQNAKKYPSDDGNGNTHQKNETVTEKKNIINIDFYEKFCWRLAIAAVVFGREGRGGGGATKSIEQAGNEVRMEHHEFRRTKRVQIFDI